MKKLFTPMLLLLVNIAFAQKLEFDEILNYYNSQENFNGVALVAIDGNIDYLNAIGISNRQSGTTLNTKSKFKIASMTKTFTAILILQLYEQGKIELNVPFGKYFQGYKGEAKEKVTIENLLTYSSGIPNDSENLGMQSYQLPITLDEYIDKYCSGVLKTVPGKESNYSNTEYIILQKILENVTNKPFEATLQENILDPLKMENTQMLHSKDIIPGITNSYTIDENTKQLLSEEPYYIENFFGAGAMYSTIEDLLKFDVGIFNNKLLNKETTELMISPNKSLDNVALGVWYADGYGIFSEPFIYRTGGILGSCSNWIHTIDDKKSIIVLNNTNGTNLFGMSEQLYLVSNGQNATIIIPEKSQIQNVFDFEKIQGTWSIDLRPSPKSEPYIKDFIIIPTKGKLFSGEFYGTEFDTGIFNTDWENLYFGFQTSDNENTYFHSGYISNDKIFGVSYSNNRKFISHWSGTKK